MTRRRTISLPQYRQAVLVAEYIRSRIAAGAYEGLSIRALSRHFGSCPSVLTRNFKTWRGMTVHAFIIELKMEKARELLFTSSEPIKVIAIELGYSEPANFSRDFTRATSMSPQAYRFSRASAEVQDGDISIAVAPVCHKPVVTLSKISTITI